MSGVKGEAKAVEKFKFSLFNTYTSMTTLTGKQATPSNPQELLGDPIMVRQQQIDKLCDTLTQAQSNPALEVDAQTKAHIESFIATMKR